MTKKGLLCRISIHAASFIPLFIVVGILSFVTAQGSENKKSIWTNDYYRQPEDKFTDQVASDEVETGWVIECVDCSKLFSKSSLRLDTSGHLDASGRYVQTIDNTGHYTSLTLDSNGYPHISYYDGFLNYAYKDDFGWHIQTIDSSPHSGLYTSMELDGSNYPHISYFNETSEDLKYAFLDADGWHIQTVDSEGRVGYYGSLVLDDSGYPHISYSDYTNKDLKYAYMDASGWHIEVADELSDDPSYRYCTEFYSIKNVTSLAFDTMGYPHISYTQDYCCNVAYKSEYCYFSLKYAYQDSSGWTIDTIFNQDEWYENWPADDSTSLVLDKNEQPHIAWVKDDTVYYVYKEGNEWHIQRVYFGEAHSMALDKSDHPHFSFITSITAQG